MSANIEKMLYTQEDGVPWHGEGIAIEGGATWKRVVEQVMDWTVTKRQLWIAANAEFVPVPKRFALTRSDTNRVLGIVAGSYKPIQNEDLFSFLDPIVAEGEAVFRTAGVIGNGERVWALAKLPDQIFAGTQEAIEFYLLLTGAHTGQHSADFLLTAVRVVCENTFNQAYEGAHGIVQVAHRGDVKAKMQEAHRILGVSRKGIEETKRLVEKLLEVPIEKVPVTQIIQSVFMERYQPEIEDRIVLLGSDKTRGNSWISLWDLVNGVTDFVDHELATGARKSRLLYTQYGTGADLKARAFDQALAVASVF